MRSILVFVGAVVGLMMLAAIVGYAVMASLQSMGVEQARDIALGVLGLMAAAGAFSVPIGPSWPKAMRMLARFTTVTAVLVGGVYFAVILGLAIHGK